jgi:hypothetical protein
MSTYSRMPPTSSANCPSRLCPARLAARPAGTGSGDRSLPQLAPRQFPCADQGERCRDRDRLKPNWRALALIALDVTSVMLRAVDWAHKKAPMRPRALSCG